MKRTQVLLEPMAATASMVFVRRACAVRATSSSPGNFPDVAVAAIPQRWRGRARVGASADGRETVVVRQRWPSGVGPRADLRVQWVVGPARRLELARTWDIDRAMRTRIAIRTLCLLGLLAGCGPKQGEQPAPSPQPQPTTAADAGAANDCSVDADCVPASCCHPNSCVPAAQQPDCAAVSCTMECQAGTLDCGGRCACEAGSCKAILGQP